MANNVYYFAEVDRYQNVRIRKAGSDLFLAHWEVSELFKDCRVKNFKELIRRGGLKICQFEPLIGFKFFVNVFSGKFGNGWHNE